MGESLISRRSGGGSGGNVAFYTGSTLPSAKTFGIYANTGSNNVTKTVIDNDVLAPMSQTGFTTSGNMPVGNITTQMGLSVDATIGLFAGTGTKTYNRGMYKVSIATGVFSMIWEDRLYGDVGFYNDGNDGNIYVLAGTGTDSSSDPANGVVYTTSLATNAWTRKWQGYDIGGAVSSISKWGNTLTAWGGGNRGGSTWYTAFIKYDIGANVITSLWSTTGTNNVLTSSNSKGVTCGAYGAIISSSSSDLYIVDFATGQYTNHSTTRPSFNRTASIGFYLDNYLYLGGSSGNLMWRTSLTNPSWVQVATNFTGLGVSGAYPTPAIFGRDIYWIASASQIYKYTFSGTVYPTGYVVAHVSDRFTNIATIASSNKTQVNVPIKAVYYSNGATLTRLSGSVRKLGGNWTAIT